MLIKMQSYIWLLILVLQSIRFGIGVELTLTPSPVTEGGSLTLTCAVTENSSVYAVFNYGNGTVIGTVQLSGGQCIDGTVQTCDQQCSCTTDGKSFSWTISSVTRSWDKVPVRCQVNNPAPTVSDDTVVSVIYPPTGTLLMTPSGTQSILTGTPVTLRCEVGGGNPLATLTWQCKGSPVAGQDLTNTTTAVSSLTLTVDRTYHQQQCVCTAGHQASPGGQFGTASVGFDVIFPPNGALTVTPSGTQSFMTGTPLTLRCEVKGGNPLATLTWQCKGSSMTGQDLTNTTTAVSRLTFTVDRTYHQQQCVCTAGHQASPGGQFGTANVGFNVTLPVTSVTITPSTNVTVDVGISTILTCTTQPHSRPTANATWYRVVSGQPQQITANISVSHDTQNSAQTTTSVLSYVTSKEDNGRTVYCTSDGGWTGSTDTTLESARVSLNVRYPPDTDPVVSGYDGSTKYTGDSVTLSCMVVGGNPAASLSLTCPNGTTSTSGTLTVTLFNTFHDRTCSCVGTHVVGGYSRTVATPTFIVNIPVTSLIITPSTTVTVDAGTSTTLTCTTQPHSRPTASVTWYRMVSGQPQQITTNISVSHDTQNSAQTTTSVLSYVPSKEDNGRSVYCTSDGGWTGTTITNLQSNAVTVNVRYRPYISIVPQVNPYVITEGQIGISLECKVTSANPPATSIVWTKEATEVSNTGVYNLATITTGHSGEYTCSVTNDVGTTAESISLVVISSPAEPNIVGITNVSSSSLTVKWSPNDQSSEPSTFNVSHRCKDCDVPDTTSIVRIPDKGVYSTTFNNLLPETLYYVNITAINKVGSSNPLDLIVSTSPEETCYSPLKVANSSSTALLVIGVVLIFISLCVLGFSIFLYRKSRLPSRTIDKQEDTSKAVVFSSVLRSEKDIEQLATAENRSHYQELDPRDIQPPSLYESPSTGDDDARADNESNNYESINADPERRHYEHIKGGSKDYVNT